MRDTSSYNDNSGNEDIVTQYSVEKIFSAKPTKSFSRFWVIFFSVLYPLGITVLLIATVAEHTDKSLLTALVFYFLCYVVAWIGHTVALRMNARAKICGFVLTEKWEKDRHFLLGKELFYVTSTSDIASQMQGMFSFMERSISEREDMREQERQRKEMLVYFLETLESEEFCKKVEHEINHPNNTIEGWMVMPMKEAKLKRVGFFGTKVTFKERRGTKQTCYIYRDFAEYKQIKKLIKDLNES